MSHVFQRQRSDQVLVKYYSAPHELSEADQHDAAARLRSIVIMAEERDTMTAEERHGLYRLRYNEKARKFGWKTYEQLMAELGRDG